MQTLFVSDVHLRDSRSDITEAFLRFLAERVPSGSALFVLGDLFDEWLGDDEDGDCVAAAIQALRALAEAGVSVQVMHGNHDFFLAERFCERSRCGLLEDEHVIASRCGRRLLLMHGDTLCTDDGSYQSYRSLVHDPAWQAEFLSLPMSQRRAQAQIARGVSQRQGALKPERIMDVNPRAVLDTLRAQRAQVLVHGHTHRPAMHDLGESRRRIVLGAWEDGGWYLRWNGQSLDADAFTLRECAA